MPAVLRFAYEMYAVALGLFAVASLANALNRFLVAVQLSCTERSVGP